MHENKKLMMWKNLKSAHAHTFIRNGTNIERNQFKEKLKFKERKYVFVTHKNLFV